MSRRLRRATLMALALAIAATGPAAAGAKKLLKEMGKAALHGQPAQETAATPPPPQPAQPMGRLGLEPAGYSARFRDVRGALEAGQFDAALAPYNPPRPDPPPVAPPAQLGRKGPKAAPASRPDPTPQPLGRDPFVVNAESGLIQFEAGNYPEAVARLKAAEAAIQPAGSEAAGAGRAAKKGLALLMSVVSGQGEIGPYTRRDHEEILQLNYLALSYLLQGDRRSYNVARRAIGEQRLLKDKFDAEVREYKANNPTTPAPTLATDAASPTKGVQAELARFDDIANLAPNAYVNPLGDYLSGVIQEIASAEEPSLRDNARIAFDSARALAGGTSPQLTAASTAMRRARVPAGERVLHVMVAEGYAPTRQVLAFRFAIKGFAMVARVPIFTPTPSAVAALEVRNEKGARLARLDPIGNFEAIVLRDQRDRMPLTLAGVAATTAASYGEAQLAAKLGTPGLLAYQMKQNAETPDTRSWSSLPRRFHVARLALPPKTGRLQLVALDAQGRVLQTAPLSVDLTRKQAFVYARATDAGLRVAPSQRLWIEGRLEADAADSQPGGRPPAAQP